MDLAPYAMRDEQTRGRRFTETPHPYRSDYQRDRDRVIHTKAFRRLEKKTQVFAPGHSDHFRNRLTHTLEVSQISRTVSQALCLNTDLCEVLALSHDIGHPPYSHEGELVLNQIMESYGLGFEHNLHALRIVDDFEEKYPAFRGLNLTFEVREGIIKHSRDYDSADEAYVDISEYCIGERPPLEAQVIDLADEIAYNAADLDDGYDSGLLRVSQMRSELRLFRDNWDEVARLYPSVEEKLLVSEVVRRIINRLVSGLIGHTSFRLKEAAIVDVGEVRRFPERLVEFDEESSVLNAELKTFLRFFLYDHKSLRLARQSAHMRIEGLFAYYDEHPDSLPEGHLARMPDLGKHRVICDYIAGMTDSYAALKYTEILGHRQPS